MMEKVYHKMLVILFFLFILTPSFVMLVSPEQEISAAEKRRLARFPAIEFSLKSLMDFPENFEKYFRDHFGLRDHFIQMYNRVFLCLFKASPHFAVICGKDGWLYFTISGVLSDYMGQWNSSEQVLQQFVEVLEDRQKWLEAQGIRYLFVPVPNKIQVYHEYLPPLYSFYAGKTVYSLLEEKLWERGQWIDFLDLLPIFQAKKQEQVLYYKTDTHWNEAGGYIGYSEIIRYLQRWFPDIQPISNQSIEVAKSVSPGDLANFFHLKDLFVEDAERYLLRTSCNESKVKEISWIQEERTKNQKFRHGTLDVAECPGQKHVAIIIHDSFGNYLRKYFTQHFKKVYFVTKAEFKDSKKLIETIQPDIVIDLHVARNIPAVLAANRDITAFGLKNRFYSSQTTILDIAGQKFGDGSLPFFNIARVGNSYAGSFLAKNNDPQFVVALPEGHFAEGGMIRALIDSPADTVLQIFYRQNGQNDFLEARSVQGTLHKGANEIFVKIPKADRFDCIRVDPGKVPGYYSIRRLQLRNL